jgi:hypothetical protein
MAVELRTLLRSRITIVWLGLTAATLLSWRIGTDHSVHAHLATIVVLLVAFLKIRFVGLYFMEVRDAPLPLRFIFEAYCGVVCTTLVILYLAAGGA